MSAKLVGRPGVPASVGELGEAEQGVSGGTASERDVQAVSSLTGPRRARPLEDVLVKTLGVAGRG